MQTTPLRRLVLGLSLCTLLVLSSSPGWPGEGEAGDVEIGLFAGRVFLDDYSTLSPDDDFFAGVRLGYFFTPAWSLEGSYQWLETDTSVPGADLEIESLRLNLLYNFLTDNSFRPYVTLGVGQEAHDAGALLDEKDLGYNAGGGVRWYVSRAFGFRLEGRFVSTDVGGFVDGTQSNFETSLGVLWSLGGQAPADTDGDHVPDRKDKCPDTPAGAIVDATGCPKDSDGDGVWDGLDRCPDTPVGATVDETGCPQDSDGDGVWDGLDRCPDTPRGATIDEAGCPTDGDGDGIWDGLDRCPDTPPGAKVDARGCTLDSDGDGVADGLDRCPDTPRGATVDASGCPEDSDGDGVWDGLDRCPDTARGVAVDETGCPLPVARPMLPEPGKPLVLRDVNFAFDSAALTPQSHAILDMVVQSLRESPEVRIEIQGHTDSKGSDPYNQRLSQARAESVRRYLVEQGIAASRLVARGYGESRPVADNDTEFGRAENRRVELARLD